MDILGVVRGSIERLPEGAHMRGLRAVMKHIQVASDYLDRATRISEDDLYTDVVYRTNQAFEGSVKEAYRVLAGKDPQKKTTFEIEEYLKDGNVLRERVLAQFSRYRQEWRNPATHDYTLDFDQDEAFLAVVSVASFAKVLVDQIAQKIAQDQAAERAIQVAQIEPDENLLKSVGEQVADMLNILNDLEDRLESQSELLGALSGYLSGENFVSQIDQIIDKTLGIRADMIVSADDRNVLIEAKSSRQVGQVNPSHIAALKGLVGIHGNTTGLLIQWHPAAKNYRYYPINKTEDSSEILGTVIASHLAEPEKASDDEQTLGDILASALMAEQPNSDQT